MDAHHQGLNGRQVVHANKKFTSGHQVIPSKSVWQDLVDDADSIY